MNVKQISSEILKYVGGRSNVKTLDRCATRLRFQLKNNEAADIEAIKKLDGVLDVTIEKGEFQVVIGKEVAEIYKELVVDDAIPGKKDPDEPVYNTAKTWQTILFPLNNTATNCFMFMMMYVSYLAVGALGVGTVLISTFLTGMRLWDAVTDPIIGFIIDKTKTKIGKFRPMIMIGYVLMTIAVILMYFVSPTLPENIRFPFFAVTYVFYIIGYTFQTACTKSGQTCITNDPKQRPLFTRCDGIYNLFLFSLGGVYVSNYLIPKYGSVSVEALHELSLTFLVIAGIFTICALAALWSKDIPENWGLGEKGTKVRFRDYWSVLKGNRAIQMLVVSASTDKLASSVASNASINICLFALVIGNYAMYGAMSMITMIPSIALIFIGTEIARRTSSKKAMVQFTWYSIIVQILLFALLFFFDPTTISMSNMGFTTIAFIALWCIKSGVQAISGNIVIPMIADCSDYETYLTGRYVPGMMGTLFSFIDKIVSAFATTFTGLMLATVGYTATLPQTTDAIVAVGSPVYWVTMAALIGLPMFGWICNIIAMKFYPLDQKKMKEVQDHIQKIKREAK